MPDPPVDPLCHSELQLRRKLAYKNILRSLFLFSWKIQKGLYWQMKNKKKKCYCAGRHLPNIQNGTTVPAAVVMSNGGPQKTQNTSQNNGSSRASKAGQLRQTQLPRGDLNPAVEKRASKHWHRHTRTGVEGEDEGRRTHTHTHTHTHTVSQHLQLGFIHLSACLLSLRGGRKTSFCCTTGPVKTERAPKRKTERSPEREVELRI